MAWNSGVFVQNRDVAREFWWWKYWQTEAGAVFLGWAV